MEPFGLLPPKVRSPSHLFRSPDKILHGQSRGRGVGEFEEGGGVNCGNIWEGSWGRDLP